MTRPPPRSTLFPYPPLFRSPQIDPEHAALPLGRLEDPAQHAERRGLPGAVGPEKPVQLATADPEVEAVHRHDPAEAPRRSEEHTSELQSQSNLVCRLLLEKK